MIIVLSKEETIESSTLALKSILDDENKFNQLKGQIFRLTDVTHDDLDYLIDKYVR